MFNLILKKDVIGFQLDSVCAMRVACSHCGTCHMASLFRSLPRIATPAIFSEAILQTCQHQLPQPIAACTAHCNIITSLQMGPLSRNFLPFSCHLWCTSHDFRASTKSIRCNSHSMTTPAFLLLGKPPTNPDTNYYARNRRLARNSTSWTQSTRRSISAPHQRCSANSQKI